MTEYTVHYNLPKPAFDSATWHDDYYVAMDTLDAVVFATTGLANIVGVWANSTSYDVAERVVDEADGSVWTCLVQHTSASSGSFATARGNNPSYWLLVTTLFANRGMWTASTNYNENDVVTDNQRVGIATNNFTSASSYDADVSNGDIITIIDSATSYIGEVKMFAHSTVPLNWKECDGSAISRTTYATLFGLIGTTYGVGDGSTTFNLPDLRGEFVRGWDHGKGTDSGRALGSNQTDALKQHSHKQRTFYSGSTSHYHGGASADGAAEAPNPNSGLSGSPGFTQNTGASETRPRNIALMHCIRCL